MRIQYFLKQVLWGLIVFPLILLLMGFPNPFQKPDLWPPDRSKNKEVYNYKNLNYDWLSRYTLTKWINRSYWINRKQLGIVKTESGWGLLDFNRNWILRPGNYKIYRVTHHPKTSYSSNVFVRVHNESTVGLLDPSGQWINSFEGELDPYGAIDLVKNLEIHYNIEHGSVFSIYPNSDYDAKTNLISFVENRFSSVRWKAFRPIGDCGGWMVQLVSASKEFSSQFWYVSDQTVFEVQPERRDYIKSSASRENHPCITNFMVPPDEVKFYTVKNR